MSKAAVVCASLSRCVVGRRRLRTTTTYDFYGQRLPRRGGHALKASELREQGRGVEENFLLSSLALILSLDSDSEGLAPTSDCNGPARIAPATPLQARSAAAVAFF